MPNYQGIYATPSGPAAGIDPAWSQSDPNSPQNNQWVLPSSDPNVYWDWSTASYKRKPAGGTQLGLPSYPGAPPGGQGPGGTPLPPYTTPTTGRAAGVQVPYSNQVINPNDASQRYRLAEVIRSPTQAKSADTLTNIWAKAVADSFKGFDDYKSQFDAELARARGMSREATDITGEASALRAGQGRYAAALDRSASDYANLNRQTAANEAGIVAEARGLIPEYDRAAQDAAAQQLGLLQNQVGRYKMGSGTPTSLGSAEQNLLAAGAARILVPMEQAKVARRYDILTSYAMPLALDIANREQDRIGRFDPFVAQQQFQSGQVTEETIAQMEAIAAKMSREDAVAFLQAVGVPVQMQQQILSGQIAQAGTIGQLEAGSRYQGLQDVLGALPTQPQFYGSNMGPYPNQNRYRPAMGPQGGGYPNLGWPGVGGGGGGAPATAPGATGGPSDWAWDATNQRWQNKFTGQTVAGVAPTSDLPGGPNTGSQSNSYYDPSTGTFYDNTTGQPTGGQFMD